MSDHTIMFVFAGRESNMEVQRPFLERIIHDHDGIELHVWNLTTNESDDRYVRNIQGDRVTVRNELQGTEPWVGFNLVYKHYARPEYRGTTFVKLDDDVVFIETAGFGEFLRLAKLYEHRFSVLSANVVNNGACTQFLDGVQEEFDSLHASTGLMLLDVHLSPEYADAAHTTFLEGWFAMVHNRASELKAISDWLSINLIAYSYDMGVRIAEHLGRRPPPIVADRRFKPWQRLGDEGVVNLFPRLVYTGMIASHLTFGPQEKLMTKERLTAMRKSYARIGQLYLEEN